MREKETEMIRLTYSGIILCISFLLTIVEGQAPENTLLETLTRVNKVCKEGGRKFQPDQGNCGRFYECELAGLARHLECPEDYLFSVDQQYCDHPERVDCGNRPRCEKETGENCVNGHIGESAAAASSDALLLAKLGVGETFHVGHGRWVQKRVKPEFREHHHGDLCPLSIINCYKLISYCPHCTAHQLEEPKSYQEGYCSPYYCVCRTRTRKRRFMFAQRRRCPAGKRFDEAYLKCRDKKDVIECRVDPDQDDDYPYEVIPFEPSQPRH